MSEIAYLGKAEDFTAFSCKGQVIRFKTSDKLERYTDISEWDNGYLVVKAVYNGKEIEEYIDLLPILDNLYIDKNEFLKDIKEVRLADD